jgi:hypothetical protein
VQAEDVNAFAEALEWLEAPHPTYRIRLEETLEVVPPEVLFYLREVAVVAQIDRKCLRQIVQE